MTSFQAMVIEEKGVHPVIKTVSQDDLPEGEVLIEVTYSSVNYKDGLAITNSAPVVRKFPMVLGVDSVGMVVESASADFKPGDAVILTGWGVGETHWGGYAKYARFKADWLVRLPEGMTPKQSMAIGTAGLTAMLCVMALQNQGVTPDSGPIVVTGAAGGVGSMSVAILAQLGYEVAASTGRGETQGDYLKQLGASQIIDRFEPTKRPLGKTLWAGGVDSVGGDTLATLLTEIHYEGSVAACGLAQSGDLPATVYPFILRGVNLLGVDSVMCPKPKRQAAWQRITEVLPAEMIESIIERVIPLTGLAEVGEQIMKGQVRGRVIVDPQA